MADEEKTPDGEEAKKPPIKIKSGEKKSDTARIDLASAKPPPSITDIKDLPADSDEYFKRSTMRIDAPETPAADPDEKKKTARIELPDESEADQDIFKKSTLPIGIPTPQPTKPTAKPKTSIQIKKPVIKGESIVVAPESTETATGEARKSETARIDLPAEGEERPATRPKTIKIKRSDGTTGRKALAIARPSGDQEAKIDKHMVVPTSAIVEDEADLLSTITSIAALVVALVVVYVLAAQTVVENLPWPGRL